jgi:hypothetical protein
LHFARTPPVTRDEHAILESIDWIAQGFEIVQCPFPDWDFAAVDTIAAYAVHGALVIGTPVLAFAHLAEVLSVQSRFPPDLAREVVSTGTLTGLMPLSAGEEWSTTISGIDLPGLSISIA